MLSITENVTPAPPPLHLDSNPPPSDIMPEASSSSMSSSIRKKMALISISPSPSTNSTPKRRYQQISEDTEMEERQSSSSPPRKVIKTSVDGIIGCWYIYCACKVYYCIKRVDSIYRITGGEIRIDVRFNKNHVHFHCPCGYRCEVTMGVRSVKKTAKLEKATANAIATVLRLPLSRRSNTITPTSQRTVDT